MLELLYLDVYRFLYYSHVVRSSTFSLERREYMHRNWSAICKVTNPWLRMLASTANEQSMLESLEQGFPELFSEDPSELLVPYSAFLAKAEEDRDADSTIVLMGATLEYFGIPILEWGAMSNNTVASMVPETWRQAIAEVYSKEFGYDVTLGNTVFLEFNGEQFLLIEANGFDAESGGSEYVTVAPAKFFEFNT